MTPPHAETDPHPQPLGRRDFLGRAAAIGLTATGAGRSALSPRGPPPTPRRNARSSSCKGAISPRSTPTRPPTPATFALPQRLRHPRAAPSRRHAPPCAGDRLATHGADHLAPHAAAGRALARRGRFTAVDAKYSLDRMFDASVKAARLQPLFQTIDADRDARRRDARHPHQAARHAHSRAARLLRPDGARGRTSTGSGSRPSTSGPSAPGRSASCRGRRGDRCILEANPDYWDGRLDLDRVVFRPVTAAAARVDALLRGDADLITGLTPRTRRPRGARIRPPGWSGPPTPASTCSWSTSGCRR